MTPTTGLAVAAVCALVAVLAWVDLPTAGFAAVSWAVILKVVPPTR
jgi:hypothetical protein